MAEPTEPEDLPPPPTPESSPGEHGADDESVHESAEARTGFTFEQRRFLWTLVGVNVVAVLLGAAIIVGYMASARSQDAATSRLGDEWNDALQKRNNSQHEDLEKMVQAKLAHNDAGYTDAMQDIVQVYQTEQEAYVRYRRARGYDEPDLTQDRIDQYMQGVVTMVDRAVQRMQASTRPATRPKTSGAGTSPLMPQTLPGNMQP